jgi:hypothetical protein
MLMPFITVFLNIKNTRNKIDPCQKVETGISTPEQNYAITNVAERLFRRGLGEDSLNNYDCDHANTQKQCNNSIGEIHFFSDPF